MNTRPLAIAAVIFFALAPSALATPCGVGGTCQSFWCGSNTTAVAGSSDCGVTELCCAPSVQPIPTKDVTTPGNGTVLPSALSPTAPTTNVTTPGNGNVVPSVLSPTPAPSAAPTTPVNIAPTTPVNTGGPNVTLINPLGAGTNLGTLLTDILKFVVQIGAVVVVLMLVYVGFLFVVAQGNETKITEARKALLWTVVGALILLGAQAIQLGITATVQSLGG